MKIYFAAPMFAKSDLLYNQQLVKEIRELSSELSIYLPQENEAINDKTAYADSRMIALLDGLTIDAGVASEIGVAYAKGIPVIGLYTDTRQQGGTHPKKIAALQETAENQFHYLNLYTIGLIKLNGKVVSSEIELLSEVKRFLDGGTFSD
ncbi:TPA: nucleoside 2-deoxyribosyltransferase [Enterococcus faecium]